MDWILEESLEFALVLGAFALMLTIRARWRPWAEDRATIRGSGAPPWAIAFEGHPGRPSTSPPGSIDGWPPQVRTEAARRLIEDGTAVVVAVRIDGLNEQSRDIASRIYRTAAASVRGVVPGAILVQDDDRGMFRVLLADADADSARAYVALVSRPLSRWLDDPHSPIRMTAGWAATSPHRDLEATDRLAEARLVGASAGWIRSASTWRSTPPHA